MKASFTIQADQWSIVIVWLASANNKRDIEDLFFKSLDRKQFSCQVPWKTLKLQTRHRVHYLTLGHSNFFDPLKLTKHESRLMAGDKHGKRAIISNIPSSFGHLGFWQKTRVWKTYRKRRFSLLLSKMPSPKFCVIHVLGIEILLQSIFWLEILEPILKLSQIFIIFRRLHKCISSCAFKKISFFFAKFNDFCQLLCSWS